MTPAEAPDGGEALVWSVTPVRRDPVRGVLAGAVSLGAVVLSFAWGGPLLAALALFILAGGIGPYYVRATYRLTPATVAVRSPFQRLERPWRDFRRAYVGSDGVSLSPFPGKHLLEPYRSVMLRYGDRRDEVLDWVRRYGPAPESRGSTRAGEGDA